MSSKNKTTATEEEARPALVPKLRFPEFRGTEGWHSGPLKDALSSISNGLALEQGNGSSGCRVTRIETISAGTIDLTKVGLIQTFEDISAYRLRVGDILLSNINSVAHIGKSVFVDSDYDLYHGMNLLRLEVNRNQHDPKFIFYAINTDRIRASLRERANKAVNQASINQTELGKTEVSLPLRPEQQKIAEYLSSVDELMAAQARKVVALKTHKKGLMQQLFPREGETQPRLRFPEFRKAGDWKLRKIGDMLVETQRPIELSDDTEYRLVTVKRRYGGLISRGIMKGREILVKSQFVVRTGDFLISKRQIVHNACGLVTQELDGSVVSNEYSVLTPKPECSIEFFSWFAMQPAVSASFMNCSVGIVIEKMLFKLPAWLKQEFMFPTLPEQQRIASCLSSLDALISAEAQKLEALKTHKKGLMQQLFPSPEEVEA